MDLRCLDLGCIEKQISQISVDSDSNPNDSLPSNSKASKNKLSKQGNQPSLRPLNRLTTQIKKPTRRKTSTLTWSPRKKGDSYLKRKLKLLQEVDGMNSTLDAILGNTNPHFSKVLREKMAVREARKAAMVEASWCRILRVSRIDSKEAEDVLMKAEKNATKSAKEIGVIMYDIQDCPRKHCKIETSAGNGGESATHTAATSFDLMFEVDKQVAAAVKAAFVMLSTCASIGEQEFKEIAKKVSQYQDLCELNSECQSDADADADFESKSHKNEIHPSKEKQKENLVDMMLRRLRCLQEEELAFLATIVATCGLNAALAEAENSFGAVNDGGWVSSKETVPGLDKVLVKRLTRLEREIHDAKSAKTKETLYKDDKSTKPSEVVTVPDLASGKQGRESCKKEKMATDVAEPDNQIKNPLAAKWEAKERVLQEAWGGMNNGNIPSLGEVLVKRVSQLEKEVRDAKKEKENFDINKEKRSKEPDNEIKNPLAAKREARERELQEAWGGMSFGNSIRPRVSRLQRDKDAWIKAEEAERRATELS